MKVDASSCVFSPQSILRKPASSRSKERQAASNLEERKQYSFGSRVSPRCAAPASVTTDDKENTHVNDPNCTSQALKQLTQTPRLVDATKKQLVFSFQDTGSTPSQKSMNLNQYIKATNPFRKERQTATPSRQT